VIDKPPGQNPAGRPVQHNSEIDEATRHGRRLSISPYAPKGWLQEMPVMQMLRTIHSNNTRPDSAMG
jgi:hypothetical protein